MTDLDVSEASDFTSKSTGPFPALIWGLIGMLLLVATAFVCWRIYNARSLSDGVEVMATYYGVIGTLLLATRTRIAGWGFVCFLASNAGWLWFSDANGHVWMFWQQVAFTISSVIGIVVWLVPRSAWELPR